MMDFPARYIYIRSTVESEDEGAEIATSVILNDDMTNAAAALTDSVYAKDVAPQDAGGEEVTNEEAPTAAAEEMQVDAPAGES